MGHKRTWLWFFSLSLLLAAVVVGVYWIAYARPDLAEPHGPTGVIARTHRDTDQGSRPSETAANAAHRNGQQATVELLVPVVVVDSGGRGLKGARVSISGDRLQPITRVTDDDGSAVLGIPLGDQERSVACTARAELIGYRAASETFALAVGDALPVPVVRLTVLEAPRLRGYVIDMLTSQPVASATICAVPQGGTAQVPEREPPHGVQLKASSNRDGSYDIEVNEGSYTVLVIAQGYLPFKAEGVAIGYGPPCRVDAIVDRGTTIAGRVMSRHGEPVAGVVVHARSHDAPRTGSTREETACRTSGDGPRWSGKATTGGGGEYIIGGLRNGVYDVSAVVTSKYAYGLTIGTLTEPERHTVGAPAIHVDFKVRQVGTLQCVPFAGQGGTVGFEFRVDGQWGKFEAETFRVSLEAGVVHTVKLVVKGHEVFEEPAVVLGVGEERVIYLKQKQ